MASIANVVATQRLPLQSQQARRSPIFYSGSSLIVSQLDVGRPNYAGIRAFAPGAAARRGVRRCSVTATATAENGAAENVVIIGSGPAGYTAAIYAARANLRPLVFEGVSAGGVCGGQLMTTTEVENFPGFPDGITGPDLMDRMRAQAERWGARLVSEDVATLDLSARPFTVISAEGGDPVKANAVIVATGATAKRLGLPSEDKFWSAGISACAICDGASSLFKNKEVAVVGGGDTATEEAIYLTKYTSHVHLLVRGERMRASQAMQARTLAHPKITVHLNTAIEDAYGDSKLAGLHLVDNKTGEKRDLPVAGLFYGIGHMPNSKLVKGQVALDEAGFVSVTRGCRTSVEGVFSAGDLHDVEWRQAITAAGSGCMAALAAERYLTEHDLIQEGPPFDPEPPTTRASPGNGAAALSADTEATFDPEADRHKGEYALRKLYHSSTRPLLVLYTAPSCGPCRTLKPIIGKVLDEYAGRVHYVEIDTEKEAEVAESAGVNGTPTVQLFKDKLLVDQMAGVRAKKDYRRVLDEALAMTK